MSRIAPLGPMIAAHTRMELVRLVRNRGFTVVTIALPLLLFFFVGRPTAGRDPTHASLVLASFCAYGVLSVTLFSVGGSIAIERSEKAVALMRVSPLRPAAYVAGKIAATVVFSIIVIALLIGCGAAQGIYIEPIALASLVVRLVAGGLPFAILGAAIGWGVSPTAATAVINLIYLPMSFASGLFGQLDDLPAAVAAVAPVLPTYHYAELAHGALGGGTQSALVSIGWLAGYSVLFALLARAAYRREERRAWE